MGRVTATPPIRRRKPRVPLYAHPFELAFGVVLLTGVIRDLGLLGSAPSTFSGLVEPAVRYFYVGSSFLGGIGILYGLARRERPIARALERAGLYFAAGGFAAYGVALLTLPGSPAALAAVNALVIAGAAVLRARAVRRTELVILDQLRKAADGTVDPGVIVDLVDDRRATPQQEG